LLAIKSLFSLSHSPAFSQVLGSLRSFCSHSLARFSPSHPEACVHSAPTSLPPSLARSLFPKSPRGLRCFCATLSQNTSHGRLAFILLPLGAVWPSGRCGAQGEQVADFSARPVPPGVSERIGPLWILLSRWSLHAQYQCSISLHYETRGPRPARKTRRVPVAPAKTAGPRLQAPASDPLQPEKHPLGTAKRPRDTRVP
jgi:hypothetical protein